VAHPQLDRAEPECKSRTSRKADLPVSSDIVTRRHKAADGAAALADRTVERDPPGSVPGSDRPGGTGYSLNVCPRINNVRRALSCTA
jgi:hypothetical protein